MAYSNFTLESVRAAFELETVYGASTTGTEWQFLKLEGQRLHIDMVIYTITQCEKILGILSSMVEQKA